MKLSTQLQKQAREIRAQSPEAVAVEMLKQAGVSEDLARTEVAQKLMEKEAADHLVASGIDYDTAVAMVKVADLNIKDLAEFKPEATVEEIVSGYLTKAASAAEDLEDQIEDLTEKATQVDALMEKIAELEAQLELVPDNRSSSEPMAKFAKSGAFTNADLEAIQKLPASTLVKMASAQDEPWRMGKGAGRAASGLDPIEEFCMS